MSYNGHRQSVSKPTGLDIYSDAAKILDELLEKHFDENLKVLGKTQRKRTALKSVGSNTAENKSAGSLRLSRSLDDELKVIIVNSLSEKSDEEKNKTGPHGGSESSVDTDYEHSQVLNQRKKKSLFKRVKERLHHTFNQHHGDGIGRITNKSSDGSPASTKHKKKSKKEEKEMGKSNAKPNDETREDISVIQPDEKSNTSTHAKVHSPSKEKRFTFISFKSAKRSLSVEENTNVQIDKKGHAIDTLKISNGNVRSGTDEVNYVRGGGLASSYQSSAQPSSLQPQPPSYQEQEISSKAPAPPPPPPTVHHLEPAEIYPKVPPPPTARHLGPLEDQSTNVLQPLPSYSKNPSPHLSHHSHSTSPSPSLKSFDLARATSTASSNLLQSDNTSDASATKLYSSNQSNVLDSPGEDIEYMDDSKVEIAVMIDVEGRRSFDRAQPAVGVHFHGSEGLLDASRPRHQTSGDIHTRNIVTHQRVSSTQRSDSNIVLDFHSDEQHYHTESKKDAIYGKIAQKLIELGDVHFVSNQETEGAAAIKPTSLNELEKEIISCLRTEGDRYSKQLDESFEQVTYKTTQEAYERFQSTVQNSVGSDPSWDHLAFLFYTTKGVVSAVGSGSRRAHRAKEFTLQYISDKFASWIMDQGGFDSVLSSEESDFDVD